MIRMQNMVPKVYYQHSRDFQFISRLYELVLNSIKTNSDMIYALPNSEDANTMFLELLSSTLGFTSLHNYNINQLKSLCSCFAEIIKSKGSIQAIEKTCNALVGAEGITDSVYIDDSDSKHGLVLYVSQELSDLSLLRDLMDYILPAGLSYSIVRTLKVSNEITTTIGINSKVQIITHGASKTSTIRDTFSQSGTTIPNILDTSGLLINTTIVDTFLPELTVANSMVVPTTTSTRTIILKNAQIQIPIAQAEIGSPIDFTITCATGYRIKNNSYEGLWFRDAKHTKAAYQLSSPTDITITHVTATQEYSVKLQKMPTNDLEVIAEIEEGAT